MPQSLASLPARVNIAKQTTLTKLSSCAVPGHTLISVAQSRRNGNRSAPRGSHYADKAPQEKTKDLPTFLENIMSQWVTVKICSFHFHICSILFECLTGFAVSSCQLANWTGRLYTSQKMTNAAAHSIGVMNGAAPKRDKPHRMILKPHGSQPNRLSTRCFSFYRITARPLVCLETWTRPVALSLNPNICTPGTCVLCVLYI